MDAVAGVIRTANRGLLPRYLCRAILLILFCSPVAALDSRIELSLPTGQEIPLLQFAGNDKSTLIWIPSERGIRQGVLPHADKLAESGHEVWIPDLHDAYFLRRDSESLNEVPIDDMVALIDAAVNRSEAPVLLLSSLRAFYRVWNV